jgi:hypothetical protein
MRAEQNLLGDVIATPDPLLGQLPGYGSLLLESPPVHFGVSGAMILDSKMLNNTRGQSQHGP